MKKKNFLALLVVLGLLISLLSVARSSASPSGVFQAAATQTVPIPRITATLPQPTRTPYSVLSTPAGKRPPACTFPLAEIKPVEAQSETYTFSEPQVVLTSQTPLGVAGWLPDGKHLLITRDLPNSAWQSIEVLNVRSGETIKYAERYGSQMPFWLPGPQSVAYDVNIMSNGKSPSVERVELWISRGLTFRPQRIASDIFSASVSPDGKQIFFFSPSVGNMLQTWHMDTQKTQSLPLRMEEPIYSESRVKIGEQRPNQMFWIAPQANNRWVALYIEDLLFLTDTQTGDVCEVDLGTGGSGPNLPNHVAWSADGRYLAMTISSGYPGIFVEPYSHILVLDVATGEQYLPDLEVPFVFELAWMPNAHTLVALGMVGVEQGRSQMGLFLLDIDQKYTEQILHDWIFRNERGALSWKPDGLALTVDCTTETPVLEFRICVTQVSVQQ